jgi:hypothetical protein
VMSSRTQLGIEVWAIFTRLRTEPVTDPEVVGVNSTVLDSTAGAQRKFRLAGRIQTLNSCRDCNKHRMINSIWEICDQVCKK